MDKEKTPIYETCGEPLIVNKSIILHICKKKFIKVKQFVQSTIGLDKVDNIIIFYLKKYKSI